MMPPATNQTPMQTPVPAIPIPEDRLRNSLPPQPPLSQSQPSQQPQSPQSKQDDDDLGIPAFIRRKMM